MIVEEIPFMLKDGRQALLRSPRDEDIPGMLDYLCATAGETDIVLRYIHKSETSLFCSPCHMRGDISVGL